jgi:two-component system, response regulator YesN
MYNLLIADDEELEREALHLFVVQSETDAVSIAECVSGTELIKKCMEIRPDIIILDINMPGLNGLEALKKIRQADCRALVIISSAYDQFDYAVAAMQLGVINFLVKPVKKEVLIGALSKAKEMLKCGQNSPAALQSNETAKGLMPQSIQRIIDYLETNYNRQISLDDIAENCGCSKYHMSHIFRQHTGTTISCCLLDLRLKKAKELLETTARSIKEISAVTGFSDPNYFSLVFKKNTGISPVQYRSRQISAGITGITESNRKSL